ncbi:unnamed protein product [Soboliphyme baturini]|uniref:UNC93-like protein n=1 Tax=Soboliphyme baturini TaxID=241478 RepID=A0A183IRK1_9BILA|nr:unnamed protein product [Soboliphyme baturini]
MSVELPNVQHIDQTDVQELSVNNLARQELIRQNGVSIEDNGSEVYQTPFGGSLQNSFERARSLTADGTAVQDYCPVHGFTVRSKNSRREQPVRLAAATVSNSIMVTTPIVAESRTQPVTEQELYRQHQLRRHLWKTNATVDQLIQRADEKNAIMINLIVLSVSFLFLMSAFVGLQNLQTSINNSDHLGSFSLTFIYVGWIASCLFTPSYLLNRVGCKKCILISMCMYSLYMLAHFRIAWYILLPASVMLGLAAAPLMAAKMTFLTESGIRYAELNWESPRTVMNRFSGIFFMIVHLGQVFGNLISHWILGRTMTVSSRVDSVDFTCGHFYSEGYNLSSKATVNLLPPTVNIFRSLAGTYFCCTLVAIMIVTLFLNELRSDLLNAKIKLRYKLQVWRTTIQHLNQPRVLLLIPLTIFNGMEQAFIAGEFTKAYIGCCVGISQIGAVMTCFGVCTAVCSFLFGPLIRLFGRMPLFMFGGVVDMLMIFTMIIWPPNPADEAIFYVIAATWGMADAVWNTQIIALWIMLFSPSLEVAYANYRLWESVGFLVAFASSAYLAIEMKLYVLLIFLLAGMVGYGLIEFWILVEVDATFAL